MFIPLDRDGPLPLVRQISSYLEEMIRRGHLSGGASLPATRTLARDLRVNRKTVEAAYDELRERRLVSTRRVGRAAVVRSSIPDNPELDLPFRAPRGRDPIPARSWCAPPAAAPDRFDLGDEGPRRWVVSPATLRRLHREALDAPGALFTPPPPLGEPRLRRAASAHLARAGILRAPDEIAVLAHRTIAMRRLLELFVPRGGRVLLDSLLDPDLGLALRAHGARGALLGAPARWRRAAGDEPRLLVVTTGDSRLPQDPPALTRRRALLDFAREVGVPVVEDVTGLDRREAPPLVPPLSTLDGSGRVIPLCDLSDELGGPFAAAAVAVTSKGIERLRVAEDGALGPPPPDRLAQRVLALALDSPGRTRALRTVRERRELLRPSLRRAIRRRLPELADHAFSRGSDAVRLDLPDGIRGDAVKRAAAERGVHVYGARDCGAGTRADRFLLLDLTRHEEGDLLAAIRELGAAFDDVAERED